MYDQLLTDIERRNRHNPQQLDMLCGAAHGAICTQAVEIKKLRARIIKLEQAYVYGDDREPPPHHEEIMREIEEHEARIANVPHIRMLG